MNALGQRVNKTLTGARATLVVYHYGRGGHLIAETDPSGNAPKGYLWLSDLPITAIGQETGNALTSLKMQRPSEIKELLRVRIYYVRHYFTKQGIVVDEMY